MQRPTGYSRAQILLHWLVVLLIAGQFLFNDAIGEAWRAMQRGTEIPFGSLVSAHIAGGVLIALLALWRLSLRFGRGVPDLPAEEPAAMRIAAHVTHWSLYGLMLLIPVSGAVAWFGGVRDAAEAHEALTSVLLVLIGLHVAAALYHHFVLKTDLMTRMRRAGS